MGPLVEGVVHELDGHHVADIVLLGLGILPVWAGDRKAHRKETDVRVGMGGILFRARCPVAEIPVPRGDVAGAPVLEIDNGPLCIISLPRKEFGVERRGGACRECLFGLGMLVPMISVMVRLTV